MTLPMLRILPHPWDFKMSSASTRGSDSEDSCRNRDKYESLRKLAMVPVQPPRNPNKPLTSFRINDILNESAANNKNNASDLSKLSNLSHFHQHSREALAKLNNSSSKNRQNHGHQHLHMSSRHRPNSLHGHGLNNNNNNNNNRVAVVVPPTRIVRPWDTSPTPGRNSEASSEADDEEINVDEDDDDEPVSASALKDVSPLDALMEMANKTFQGLETSEAADAKRREQAALFGKHSTPKRRRKSRTAFTNQQIYELEKRFLYQKYLTPADRDEIAQHLGLTNAQVITWFQNRRAKLKRDLEELKNDVVATKQLSISGSSDHEFGVDSDSDCGSMSVHTPPKRCRSESQSPDPRIRSRSNSPRLANSNFMENERKCDTPGEIVVDDKDEFSEHKET